MFWRHHIVLVALKTYRYFLSKLQMDSKAFKALLSWLYTLRLEVELDDVHSVIMLARQCRHDDLVKELDDKWRHVTSFRKI